MAPMKLKQIPAVLRRSLLAKTNIWIWGEPGIGKTHMYIKTARTLKAGIPDLYFGSFYAPTMSPTDIQCAMPNMETGVLDIFNNGALPNGYDPAFRDRVGFIHFGEPGNTDSMTFKLLQKYVNGEDMNGKLIKPENMIVIGDGNRLQDKSNVIQQGRAMMNRFEHIDVYTDASDNIEFADENSFHPTIQKFFKDNTDHINNYERVYNPTPTQIKDMKADEMTVYSEEGKRGIWASMRGWERISNKEYAADQLRDPLTLNEIAGSVGTGVAHLYDATRKYMDLLAQMDDIRADPKKAKLPKAAHEIFAQACIVALKCESKDMPAVHTYCTRMPSDFQVVVLKRMTQRKNFKLTDNNTYLKWIEDPQIKGLLLPSK